MLRAVIRAIMLQAALCISVYALCSAADAGQLKRPILALYDGTVEDKPRLTRIHRHAEVVLNHLGYVLEYADVSTALPQDSGARFAGVITWFSRPLPAPVREDYVRWLTDAMRAGARAIILDEVGGDMWSPERTRYNRLLAAIGLRHAGKGVTLTAGTRIERAGPDMIGFERSFDPVPPSFPILEPVSDTIEVVLEVRAPARESSVRSVLAAIGPSGGYISTGFALTREPYTGRMGWLVDPFRFFSKALKRPLAPVPDVTTISGRRVYFSHIDGIGLHNVQSSRRDSRGRLFVTLLQDELVAPFSDLPVTIGIIAGDVDPAGAGSPNIRDATRRLVELPNVELAVHTYSHPNSWEKLQSSDPATLERIEAPAAGWSFAILRRAFLSAFGFAPDTQRDAQAMPLREHRTEPFTAAVEIDKAISIVNALVPDGKTARLYQWTGDNLPAPAFIEAVKVAGLANINGGDSRYDADYPSIAYLAPLTAPGGSGARQVYAPVSGGSRTSAYWRPPYDALTMLRQTFDRTATPRLKPISLHYSLSLLGEPLHRNRIRQYLREIQSAPVVPISAARYAAIVKGFHDTAIEVVDPARTWIIHDRGAVQTLRLDGAEDDIDLAASPGVIGYRREGASLYIALDAAVAKPTVTLASRTAPAEGQLSPSRAAIPSLVESRWLVSRLWRGRCSVRFAAEGFGDGHFAWAGMEPRTYDVMVRNTTGEIWRGDATANDAGRLTVTLPVKAISPVTVWMRCREPQRDGASR